MKEKKEVITCVACCLPIDNSSQFIEVCHYKKKNDLIAKQYFHIRCYQDKVNYSINMARLAQQTSNMMGMLQERIA